MTDPIYVPKGRAKEYGDYALNIYNGCPHGCTYCYAPAVMHRTRAEFAAVTPRSGIVDAVIRQLDKTQMTDQTIHLCFTCDPYPVGINTETTRQIIMAIKARGNHVQILTKASRECIRDFDLLDSGDRLGVTFTGADEMEPGAAPNMARLATLIEARRCGIKTWVSFEPIVSPKHVYWAIAHISADEYKFGKLNHSADAQKYDWGAIGRQVESLCKQYGRNYVIKDDLRAEMEREV